MSGDDPTPGPGPGPTEPARPPDPPTEGCPGEEPRDLGGLFGEGARALAYLVAILALLVLVFLVTRLPVPGPLES